MSKTILSIKDLKVNYGGIEAVKGISFDVEEGEIVTLIGANGAGKSSTLRTISGLVKPSAGVIEFAGDLLGNDLSAKDQLQRKQAMELTAVETLTETEKKLCKDFFYLDELSVPERFHFCRKYLKYGFLAAFECSISAQKML